MRDYDIRPGDVREVRAFIGEFGRPLCEPLEGRRKPATTLDAKFSIPFTIAAAIAGRNVVIADYTAAGLVHPGVLSLAQQVVPVLRPEMKKHGDIYPADIEIETARGTFRRSVDMPYGHPRNPMSMEAIADKFRDCARYSANPLSTSKIENVVRRVTRLEDEADAAAIMASMA